ncbi:hypothetical protein [Pseudomonas savastanoi]|nr:hypothetical protein [Pseudomonas savastanoi]
MAKDDKKSKGEASKASKDLKDKKASPAKKSEAASTLLNRPGFLGDSNL